MKGLRLIVANLSMMLLHDSFAYSTQIFNHLSLAGSLGYMEVEAREYVYDTATETKISQLNWNNDGLAVLKGEANYAVLPFMDLNARGWVNLGDGNALLDDYDWLIPGQIEPSHHSHHSNTTLANANQFDLSARFWFAPDPTLRLGVSAGYQRSLYSFLARGGCYSYLNGAITGCIPEGLAGIGYQQTFSSPYVGLLASYRLNSFEVGGIFEFSNLVSAKDVDQHYLRSLTFYDHGNNFQYFYGALNVGYYYTPCVKFFVEGTFSYFPNNSADTVIYDGETQLNSYAPIGSAGLSNKSAAIALGVQYFIDSKKVEYVK